MRWRTCASTIFFPSPAVIHQTLLQHVLDAVRNFNTFKELGDKILFFDEPSASLDPVVASQLDDLILKLRDAMGMSIVVVIHELDSAFKIADRITVGGQDIA